MLLVHLRSYKFILFIIGCIFVVQLFLALKLPSILTSIISQADEKSQPEVWVRKQVRDPGGSSLIDDEELGISTKDKSWSNSNNSHNNKNSKNDVIFKELGISNPLNCFITKEVASAIQRASTDSCRKHIIDVACAIQNGTFYPRWLPSSCPSGKHVPNRYLGCFRDQQDNRLLNGYLVVYKTNNTPRKCIQLCLQSGFIFAGTQYSNECFCGQNEPPAIAKLPDNSCNMKCSGDPSLTCGGFYTVAVYETGIEKFTAQHAETIPRNDQKPVKIAFLLTLNGRAIRQVFRLIKSLYRPNHFFYIHIDSRQRYMFRELLSLESKFSNIRLARQRYSTIWGGASLLQMLLAAMKDLLQSPWDWDYIINLSESDFPVKTVDKLVRFLTANSGKNFVKSHGRETQRFIQKQGLDKTFVECDNHMWRIGERELPENMQIDGGSDWLALSRDFVRFVVEERDELVQGLLKIFGQTLLPAESFFHTVLRNSRFCQTYIDNNLHITNWRRKLGCKCQYKHVVDWCGCSPNDFKPEDWSRLEGTEQKAIFFARKFEPVINHAVVIQLEEWVYGAYPENFLHLYSYWQNVYHHFDDAGTDRDAILSISNVVTTITAKKLKNVYVPGAVLEVTNFFERDTYKGFLIRHEATLGNSGDIIELEIWTKPNQTAQVSKTISLGKRITLLEVSTDFDQKEQISRNFAKTIGFMSEPHLMMKFHGSRNDNGVSYNFTILWYEPNGELADISEIFVDDATTTSINYAKPLLKTPLSPGVWLVKVLHKRALIGLCKFYVAPSNFNELHAIAQDSSKLLRTIQQYFTIRDICIVRSNRHDVSNKARGRGSGSGSHNTRPMFLGPPGRQNKATSAAKLGNTLDFLTECRKTSWSSLAPDPKSDITLLLTNT